MTERLRVIGIATVSTVVFFFIANAFGADLRMRTGIDGPIEEMSWFMVVLVTLVVGFLGLFLALVLDRFSSGRTIWTVIAVAVYFAMFGSLSQLELTGGDLVWQAILHSVYAILLIVGFWVGWPQTAQVSSS